MFTGKFIKTDQGKQYKTRIYSFFPGWNIL